MHLFVILNQIFGIWSFLVYALSFYLFHAFRLIVILIQHCYMNDLLSTFSYFYSLYRLDRKCTFYLNFME
jgi:hypothetical protein